MCFRTILVYFSHVFLLLLLCGIKPVNFISYYSITSYLHIAVVFSCFQSFARSCNNAFFYVDFSDWEKNEVEFLSSRFSFLNCTSWCRWAKNFILLSYQNFQYFFARLFFSDIFYFICFNTFYAETGKFEYCGERNSEQKDRKVKASEFLVANHN